jgi:hypothetical protein
MGNKEGTLEKESPWQVESPEALIKGYVKYTRG